MATLTKIDSNVTELRFCEEDSYKTVSGDEVWFPLEPNSYNDFGGQISTVARRPINPSYQQKKGVTTDLDATGGFENDLTQLNLQRLLQGFFFASFRRKSDVGLYQSPASDGLFGEDADYTITDIDTTADTITVDSRVAVSAAVVVGGTGYALGDIVEVTDVNATVTARFVVTGVSGGVVTTAALSYDSGTAITYGREGRTDTDTGVGAATTKVTGSGDDALTLTVTYGNGLTWLVGDLLFLSGNNDVANDGLKSVASVADNVITVNENLTTDAAPASTAKMSTVGHQFAANDLNVVVSGDKPVITSDISFDFSTLPIIPGEYVYVGGDAGTPDTKFQSAVNNGFCRVFASTAAGLTLDKTESTMVAESLSGGETVQIFYGRVLKNESDPTNQVRRTYQLERKLGAPDDSYPAQVQAEYIVGCVPGEFELSMPTADKVTCSLNFVGATNETKDGPTSLKAGTRPTQAEADAFNTSSDVPRINLSVYSATDAAPTPLFAYVTDLSISINPNVSPNKAVGTLGAFEVTRGLWEVGGNMTAYFQNVAGIEAVRNNSNVTLDLHLVKDNAGITIDMPLITLSDARPDVSQDEAITLPLDLQAATGALIDASLDHTLLMVFWDYLPDAAE